MELKGYRVDIKGYMMDLKGYRVDLKGYGVRGYLPSDIDVTLSSTLSIRSEPPLAA